MQKETKKSAVKGKLGSQAVSSYKRQNNKNQADHSPIYSTEISRAPKHKNIQYLVLFSLVLAVIVTITSLFFTSAHKSFAHIYIGSIPVQADSNTSQLESKIKEAAKNYQLRLHYTNNVEKYYPLNTVGIDFDAAQSAKKAKNTVSKLTYQRLMWWKPVKIPVSLNINQTTFRSFIDGPATQATVAAKDATLAIDNGKALVTPETLGKGDSINNAEAVIPKTVSAMLSSPIRLQSGTVTPAIKATDLNTSKTKLDGLLSQSIVLNIDGKAIKAKPTDIANWVELTPIKSAKTVDVNVNSGKIVKYIDQIAKPYVQPPRSRLIVNTAEGLQVLDPGKDGIDVINKDQAASAVAQSLTAGKGVNTNLDVKYAASKTVEVQPHDKWIVVDVTTKRMYAYEQTNLVKTFLVSAGAPKTPTVLGQYSIFSKTTSQDMRGFNADGSRYFQPRVPYVNYFYKDYAIHGNYWRPASYFGNINSSHGCVGVPVSEGEWIYNWAPIGTPVIVHN